MIGSGRLTTGSAALGAVVWLAVVVLGRLTPVLAPLSPTRRLFLLAPLVVVPLCLGLVGDDVRRAALLQPPAALLATASVLLPAGTPAGLLSLPWVGVTAVLAWSAVRRLRGGPAGADARSLSAVLIDAGLLYSTVGSTALLLSTSGLGFPGFGPTLVFLAAVHFHFAGFVVPVLAGRTGDVLSAESIPASADRVFRPVAWVVAFGPGFIGLGITFSPLVEVVAVTAFTVAVAALAVLTLAVVARELDPLAGALVGASALVLPVSMALALAFGLSVYLGVPVGLDIPTMVRWHGHLNALGFAVPGALGWRLASRP